MLLPYVVDLAHELACSHSCILLRGPDSGRCFVMCSSPVNLHENEVDSLSIVTSSWLWWFKFVLQTYNSAYCRWLRESPRLTTLRSTLTIVFEVIRICRSAHMFTSLQWYSIYQPMRGQLRFSSRWISARLLCHYSAALVSCRSMCCS